MAKIRENGNEIKKRRGDFICSVFISLPDSLIQSHLPCSPITQKPRTLTPAHASERDGGVGDGGMGGRR